METLSLPVFREISLNGEEDLKERISIDEGERDGRYGLKLSKN